MASNSIKTVHHAKLEQFRSLNNPFSAGDPSLLNNYFEVLETESVPAPVSGVNKYPTIKYLAVGTYPISAALTGGQPPRHRCTDGRLFRPIPWLVVTDSEDAALDQEVKDKYRMRVTVAENTYLANTGIADVNLSQNEQDGVFLEVGYVYYFLKVIDLDAITPVLKLVTVENGIVVSENATDIVADDLDNPRPVDITNATLNQVTGEHVMVQSALNVVLDSTDFNNLRNACLSVLGTDTLSITEYGLCSGYDKVVGGGYEVTHAQVCNFIGTNISLDASGSDSSYTLTSSLPKPSTVV